MKSLNTHGDLEILGPAENADVFPTWQEQILDYFLQVVAVAAGVFFGAILALVIGLCTGWIEFAC